MIKNPASLLPSLALSLSHHLPSRCCDRRSRDDGGTKATQQAQLMGKGSEEESGVRVESSDFARGARVRGVSERGSTITAPDQRASERVCVCLASLVGCLALASFALSSRSCCCCCCCAAAVAAVADDDNIGAAVAKPISSCSSSLSVIDSFSRSRLSVTQDAMQSSVREERERESERSCSPPLVSVCVCRCRPATQN